MARTPNETIPTQFRLKADTLAQLDCIAEHFKLGNRTATVRFLAEMVAEQLPPPKTPRKKSRKKSEKTA